MSQGIFPDKLKTTVIKPLFKRGSKLDVSNYRPIALLSPFSKVSEKVYLKRVLSYLSKNTVLTEDQFGYRKGSSCVDATIILHHTIAQCKTEKSIEKSIALTKKVNLMTLAGLFIYSAAIYARKHLSTQTCSSVHSHNTRNSDNLYVKKFVKDDVSLKCVQVFNKLPILVKQAPNMA